MPEMRWGATTNPGLVRTENEDTYVTEPMVFAVADGMGGHQAGEVASALAASIVRDRLGNGAASEDDAESVVHEVNAAIYGAARANSAQSGMGTTLTALAVLNEQGTTPEQLVLLNVGDSRTYLYRNGRLQRVTVDHSYVQELVATGHITIEEARTHPRRNIVTRALGIEPNVRADMWTMPIVRGDRFILCSDGLVDEVPDNEILDLVADVADPQSLSEQLVAIANRNGGRDNVTVVVVDVLEGADPPDPTEELALDLALAEGASEAAIWRDDSTGEAGDPGDRHEPAIVPGSPDEAAHEMPLDGPGSMPTVPPPAVALDPDHASTTSPIPLTVAPTAITDQADASTDGSVAADAVSAATTDAASTAVKPTLPTASTIAAAPAAPRRKRDKPEKTAKPDRPRKRRLTGGLFLFVVVLAAIIITTFTLIAVHARSGYFVGFDGDTVVVYKGQPGGVLWFDPTVAQVSDRKRQELDPTTIDVINQHVTYDSAEQAAAFIHDLVIPTTTTVVVTTTTTEPASTSTTVASSAGATTTTVSSGP